MVRGLGIMKTYRGGNPLKGQSEIRTYRLTK